MENKKLYLNSVSYNMVRVHDEVLKIATTAGAKIVKEKYNDTPITIYNRSISEKIRKNEKIIQALEKHGKNADSLKKENEELENLFENSAYTSNGSKYSGFYGLYFRFVLNGFMYEYSQEDNPFFDAHVRKIKLDENNTYTGDFYCENDEKHEYFYDSLFSINATNEDIHEISQALFDYMLNEVKTSQEYIERTKRRVPNYYNNGYHYETIAKRSNKKTVLEFA